MRTAWTILVACLSNSVLGSIDPPDHYTNEWVVRMNGGPEEAELLALKMGYNFLGELPNLKDTYRLQNLSHATRSKREATHHSKRLSEDERVIWVEQQEVRPRPKRDFIDFETIGNKRKRPSVAFPDRMIDFDEAEGEMEEMEEDTMRDSRQIGEDLLGFSIKKIVQRKIGDFFMDMQSLITPSFSHQRFNDDLWEKQWYLHKSHSSILDHSVDMNILPCYDMGITGEGIRVVILDDGIEGKHPDLRENYDPSISYDMNSDDSDPTPKYDLGGTNAHGTRCAGEVAMSANNHKCGVGVAFHAKIGGIRMLDGPVTDRIEASSLGYASDLVDIYSASWGPTDDGETLDGPGRLVRETFLNSIAKGRNGSGTIFVWASGNGGGKGDSCSCDGYVNSIYTLTISSASQFGIFPWYGEKCAATMTTTYSSGTPAENMIVTTDLLGRCTTSHTGTSASAPIAAGIIALVLEARPELTWRDVQHIVVRTSRPGPLKKNIGWQINGAGLMVNTRFGFGLMDAHAMVMAAKDWITVPPQVTCNFTHAIKNETLHPGKTFSVVLSPECPDVMYLEHLEMEVNIFNKVRGALEVYLVSPQGTREQVLYKRGRDKSSAGFKNWKFLSVLTWNENPQGDWTIEVLDTCKNCPPGSVGNFSITMYGTKEPPHYLLQEITHMEDNEISKKATSSSNIHDLLMSLLKK